MGSTIQPVPLSILKRLVIRALQLVALVVAGVLVAFLVGFYAENRDNPMMPSGRWLGWFGYTVLLGVFIIRDHPRHWNRASFWLVLAGLFAVHTALYAVAFQALDEWRGIWFFPISIAEYSLSLFAFHWLGYRAGRHQRHTQ